MLPAGRSTLIRVLPVTNRLLGKVAALLPIVAVDPRVVPLSSPTISAVLPPPALPCSLRPTDVQRTADSNVPMAKPAVRPVERGRRPRLPDEVEQLSAAFSPFYRNRQWPYRQRRIFRVPFRMNKDAKHRTTSRCVTCARMMKSG